MLPLCSSHVSVHSPRFGGSASAGSLQAVNRQDRERSRPGIRGRANATHFETVTCYAAGDDEPGLTCRRRIGSLVVENSLATEGGRIGRSIDLHSPEAVTLLVAAGPGFSFMSMHGLSREFREAFLGMVRGTWTPDEP